MNDTPKFYIVFIYVQHFEKLNFFHTLSVSQSDFGAILLKSVCFVLAYPPSAPAPQLQTCSLMYAWQATLTVVPAATFVLPGRFLTCPVHDIHSLHKELINM